MTHDPSVIEIAPGTIRPGNRQFIRRVFADDLNDNIEIQLPGQVLRCGDQYDFAILPYAQILHREGPLVRAALLGVEVRDELGLNRAMAHLEPSLYAKPITGFAIRIGSHKSFGAALDAAEKSAGGCGCGGHGSGERLPATLSVGVRHDGDFVWTHPVLARIAIFASIYSGDGSFFFNCHSVWFGWTDRSTACGGPCPKSQDCRCDDAGEPKVRFNCFGEWKLCICK